MKSREPYGLVGLPVDITWAGWPVGQWKADRPARPH